MERVVSGLDGPRGDLDAGGPHLRRHLRNGVQERQGVPGGLRDYGEMAITSGGKTVGVWGEGPSYLGPGAVWFNRQT